MRKHLLFTAVATMAMSLTGTLSSMAQGYQTTIPFVETFDDETHYTLGGDLPDGWLGCSGNEDEKGFVKTQYYDKHTPEITMCQAKPTHSITGTITCTRP